MSQWLTAFTGVGVGSVLAVLLQGLFGKRKLSAEATKIITDAASGVVKIQEAELARVLASNVLLNGKVDAMQIEREADREWRRHVDQLLAMHQLWDVQVTEIAQSHGIDLPPPPPLNTGS